MEFNVLLTQYKLGQDVKDTAVFKRINFESLVPGEYTRVKNFEAIIAMQNGQKAKAFAIWQRAGRPKYSQSFFRFPLYRIIDH